MADHVVPERTLSREVASEWGLSAGLGAVVLAFVIYQVAATGFYLTAQDLYRRDTLLFSLLGYQFLVLGVAISSVVLIFMRHRAGPGALGYHFPGWNTLLKATALVPVVFIGVALISFVFDTFIPGYHLQGNARELLQNPNQHIGILEKVVVFLWAAVEAPFAEETLFRGILFQGVRNFFTRRFSGRVAIGLAAVISGCIFGLAHPEPHTWPILIFLGIVLAIVFQWWRSIYCSVLIHGVVNGLAVISVFHTS